MAATLHDESQIVLAGEIDGRHDILCRLGGHSVGAWPRRPGIDPAEGLGQPDLVAEVVGVLQFLKTCAQLGLDGASMHAASGDCTLTSRPPTSRLSRSQLASDGHAGSPGRTRDMERAAPTARVRASTHEHIVGRNVSAVATVCKKRLLFISLAAFGLDFTGDFGDSSSS